MAIRTLWQDLFYINVSSSITGTAGFTGDGLTDATKLLGLTESVFFKEPSGYYEYAQTTGKAYRTFNEYTQTYQGEPVEYSIGMQATAYSVSLIQQLFFHSGNTQSTGSGATYKYVSIPYTTSTPNAYAEFLRILQDTSASDGVDEKVVGSICTSFTISGEKGATAGIEATMQGASFSQGDYGTNADTAGQMDATVPFKFQALTANIGNSGANPTTALQVPSFSVTVSQTPSWAFYNDTKASNVALGPIEVSGSISFPWGGTNYGDKSAIDDFINGQAITLWLYWGDTTGGDNSCVIKVNCYITDYSLGGDNEIMVEATLTGIASSDGSQYPIEIQTGYDSTKLDRS